MGRPADLLRFAVTVGRLAEEHELRYPAAALAYYAFVSLLPVLVLVVAVVGDRMVTQLQRVTPRVFTPEAQQLIGESIGTASGRSGASLLAIGVLAWSVANVAVDVQTVVERVERRSQGSLLAQLVDGLWILGAFALVVVAVVLLGAASVLVPPGPGLAVGLPIALFAVLAVALLPLYVLPSRVVDSFAAGLPGAATAAFGLTALSTGIQFFAANAARYALYGVLSGIIIVLTSLYLAALVLMLGFVVNAARVDGGGRPSRAG